MNLITKLSLCTLINLIYTIDVFCQEFIPEKFNLNFEILDGETAKDWRSFGNGDYKISIDTIIAQNGKNSASIEFENGTTGFKALSFTIPARYKGKKIKLSGYVKTEDVSVEFAGLWMRIDPKLAFDNMQNRGITGTTEWQKYEIELDYDYLNAEHIVVGGLLAGKGKMWIDNLEVTIDGKQLKDVEFYEKPQFSEAIKENIINQLKENRKDLKISSPKTLDKNLQSLVELIGDKKIIAIGEDTHGTSEFYKLREAITKKLILEKGFNVVVLENPYDDIELLFEQIQTKSLDTLMRKHLFSIYQTDEMKSFLNWMKSSSLNTSIQLKGCDDSYWAIDQIIKQELTKVNDYKLNELCLSFIDKSTLGLDEYLTKHPDMPEPPKSEMELGMLAYQEAKNIETHLISKNLYSERFKELVFNIKTSYVNFQNMSNKQPLLSRDQVMAERISFFANDSNSKIIVWAHNAHISNTVIIDNEIGIMGKDLKELYGENYFSIGMSSLEGNYSYIENNFINNDHDYDDEIKQAKIMLQPKESWENIFSKIKSTAYYFQSENIKVDDFTENLKLIGYGKEMETDYYKLSPLKMFDAIFFIKSTSPTTKIFN